MLDRQLLLPDLTDLSSASSFSQSTWTLWTEMLREWPRSSSGRAAQSADKVRTSSNESGLTNSGSSRSSTPNTGFEKLSTRLC
eukprot:9050307-Pyramimonas_sp.AAC.1